MDLTFDQWVGLTIAVGVVLTPVILLYAVLLLRRRPKEQGARADVGGLLRRLHREPALIGGLIGAAASLLMAFGIELDGARVARISAGVSIGVALAVRHFVTPVHDPVLPDSEN